MESGNLARGELIRQFYGGFRGGREAGKPGMRNRRSESPPPVRTTFLVDYFFNPLKSLGLSIRNGERL